MLNLIKILLLVAVVATPARAETVSLSATADTYVDSTNRTFNYGSSVEYYIGNRTGTAETDMLIYFDVSSIPSNATINTAICSLWCSTIANADGWYIRLRPLDSSWVVGTGNGAYQNGGVSWTNQGIGTGVGGVSIATNDSGWGTVATGTVPPAGGAWSGAVVDSEIVNSTTDSTIVFDNASFVALIQDWVDGSRANYGIHLHGTSAASSRRVVVLSNESATTARRPKLTLNYDLPGDSTLLKFVVTPPSAPLTDYPVRVHFAHRGVELDLDNLVFFAADTTTPLYWCPDSATTDTLWAWVKQSWSTSPENIFVTQEKGYSGYRQCDNVFIVYETFNSAYSATSRPTSWDEYNCTVFDTTGPFLAGSSSATTYADSLMRESSALIRDWQESDATLRYKWFYCGDGRLGSGAPIGTRYTDNILLWASAASLSGAWTKRDTVRYDSSATTKMLRVEDPDFAWLPDFNLWLMAGENHQTSDAYHVGLYLADSLDQPVWQFYKNVPLLEASTLGGPTNWLNKEQASPALCWSPNRDTLYMAFEAYDGAGTDKAFTGMAASYQYPIGETWHLMDSTGEINDANPSPILPYGGAGVDSTKTIPDAMLYLDGEYAMSNHGSGPSMFYTGTTIPGLAFQQPTDSAKLAALWWYDSTDANYTASWIGSASGNDDSAYIARARYYNPSAFNTAQNDFTLLARSTRYGSYHRFLGGEVASANGMLTMYPSQNFTGCLALMSTDSFNTGVVIDVWMQNTARGDGTPYLTIAIGNDSLQDNTGGGYTNALSNANWYRTTTTGGYSLYIHPTATRFYDDTVATAQRGIASAITFDADGDTLGAMHKYTIEYTSGDSLLLSLDGVRRISGKDATWNGTYKRFLILQGEEQLANRGGVTRIDSVRVRKLTTADATATTGFLYLSDLGEINEVKSTINSFMRSRVKSLIN